VKALRDVSVSDLEQHGQGLEPVARRRARHIVSENDRTVEAAAALQRGDVTTVGRLMDQSHVSLRDDFEVSSAALDTIVEIAHGQEGCIGARMTGAGFGGCAVALVELAAAAAFTASVTEAYRAATGLIPALYVSTAQPGASAIAVRDLGRHGTAG
jgi:galactokinase